MRGKSVGGRSFSSLVQSAGWPITSAMQHTDVFVIRTYVSGSQTQLVAYGVPSPRSHPICGTNHQIIHPPKSRAVLSLLSRLPSFSEGDRWARVVPRAPWALPHLEPATSLLAHASADHCRLPPSPSSPASCQCAPLPNGCIRRGHLCVDSNSIPVDLCGVTDHRDATPRALLLAVCCTSVIPKQAMSVQCLLIHLPQGVEAQPAALTVNAFPKVCVTASHLPHTCVHTHMHIHNLCDTHPLIELTSSCNRLILRVKRKLERCRSPRECEPSLR